MRLFYWEAAEGPNNFGDVRPFPDDSLLLVAGAGAGYGRLPTVDDRWRFYAVRGPRTAARLGLPPEAAAVDPGVLVRRHFPWGSVPREAPVALMPHWRTANAAWRAMAGGLGWTYVDPRAAPDEVMRAIAGAELLVTEALHGAVVADAFRVPWVPIRTSREILAFKWEDWCESVGLVYEPFRVHPMYARPGEASASRRARQAVKRLLVERELRSASRSQPLLSSTEAARRAEDRLDAALARLREDHARGRYQGWTRVSRAGAGSRRGVAG